MSLSDALQWCVLIAFAVAACAFVMPRQAPEEPSAPYPAREAVQAGIFGSLQEALRFTGGLTYLEARNARVAYVRAGCPGVVGRDALRLVQAQNVLLLVRDLEGNDFDPAEEDFIRANCWPPGVYPERGAHGPLPSDVA